MTPLAIGSAGSFCVIAVDDMMGDKGKILLKLGSSTWM